MMKKIEDYIHLYKGCDCMLNVGPGEKPVKFKLTLYNLNYYKDYLNDIIPILRPLSSMTEEEFRNSLFDKNLEAFNETYSFEMQYRNFSKNGLEIAMYPNQFIYLLSKHFDLFNLIPEGLAIDSTKQK